MKLAIVGYGKMGKLIEQLASQFDFEVALKLDIDNNVDGAGITAENFRDVDVAIEFSTPTTVVANIERISALGVGLVVGATGWYEQLPQVRAAVERSGSGLVYSPNFSVGVQVFYRIVENAARLLRNEEDYDAWAYEIHHKVKHDAPAGTLLKLKHVMEQGGYKRRIDTASNRAGAIPGAHQIGFDSEADTITLTHTARSRLGFARGALKAARWIAGRRGVYEFGEVFFS